MEQLEQMKRDFPSLFYPVRKVRSDELVPGIATNSYNEYKVVVETPKGLKEVNSCSDVYRVFSNEEILLSLLPEISRICPVKLVPKIYQDAIFKIDLVMDRTITMGGRVEMDEIFPSFTFYNSYNGKIKLSGNVSCMRLICTNGMMAPVSEFSSETYMHTANNGEGLAISEMMNTVQTFLDNLEEIIEPFRELRAMPVYNLTERVDEIIEETKFPITQRDAVLDRIQYEMAELGFPKTDWLVYNGFNFQLNHNTDINMAPHKKSQMDSQIQNFILTN
jgi:hypothetical protein